MTDLAWSIRHLDIGDASASFGRSSMDSFEMKAMRSKVARQDRMIELLLQQAREKEEKELQLKQVVRTYHSYMDSSSDATDQINKILSANLYSEYDSVIVDVMEITEDLQHQGIEANEALTAITGYPNGKIPDEDEANFDDYEPSVDYCDPDVDDDAMHWDNEVYYYDSDGRLIEDEE